MTRASATSIPYEVLLNIFTHLIDPEAIETGDQPSLKHATLVCRTWVNPAQSILWQSGATLQGDRDVEKFVSTASRRRVGPKEISLHGLRDAKSLPKLWDSIKGVESLYIVAQGVPISAATFDHPALAGKVFILPLSS
ncbi:F-box protein [Sporobolomyces koalae]|uniref:F-box protein n=1 Tax=Sporobolomyces koalae TaxID=500713 RepID=UPI00316EEEE7